MEKIEVKKYQLLIVEDDKAIRESLKDLMEMYGYDVRIAENGEDGLKKAHQHLPDLVISDVTMPKMDGFELLKELRKSSETELIPVILLTARVELDAKLKGLELGADDYVTKPFQFRELQLKIHNLLQMRQKLLAHAKDNPGLAEAQSQDLVFLKKLRLLLDEKLESPNLRIENIAFHLNISPSTLNRRLKQITGKSPNQFLKEFRLQRAKEMIQLDYGNLSEIAMKTGFNSLSYFSSCYKEFFGCSPKGHLAE